MPVLNPFALIENRVNAIRVFHKEANQPRAELDVSGGIDSAVMLGLLSEALGGGNVTAIWIGIDSSEASLLRAREVAETFKVKLIEYDATSLFHHLVEELQDAMDTASGDPNGQVLYDTRERVRLDSTILGSIRSTLRAPIGRAVNRLAGGGIRHGTGNEDEDRILRFYQKGGDGEVDTNPIAMLSKGEVFQLARAQGVPASILKARPSPDLWGTGDAHSDEEEIKSYLGLEGCEHTMYSYIDMATGAYVRVGLVERLSRFCDQEMPRSPGDAWRKVEDYLFAPEIDWTEFATAHGSPHFQGIDKSLVSKLLASARKVEAATKHKMNPAIPMLGDRADLLRANILTNTLPAIP